MYTSWNLVYVYVIVDITLIKHVDYTLDDEVWDSEGAAFNETPHLTEPNSIITVNIHLHLLMFPVYMQHFPFDDWEQCCLFLLCRFSSLF